MRLETALHAPPAALASTPVSAPPGLIEQGLQVGGSLLLVLVLIVGLAALARRLRVLPGAGARLRVVGALPLGARERLLIVEAEGRRLLLSSSPAGLQLVHDLGAGLNSEQPSAGLDDAPAARRLLRAVGAHEGGQ